MRGPQLSASSTTILVIESFLSILVKSSGFLTESRCVETSQCNMSSQPARTKRQKREDYRKAHKEDGLAELPKKKFYRQRAHANPFSDHQLH